MTKNDWKRETMRNTANDARLIAKSLDWIADRANDETLNIIHARLQSYFRDITDIYRVVNDSEFDVEWLIKATRRNRRDSYRR